MKNLRNGKSAGHDLIINEMVKNGSDILAPLLVKVFNMVIKYETFPKNWILGYISPIFKGGVSGDLANYRPIRVTSNLSKIFHIKNQRLMNFLNSNNLLRPEQIGFRMGCSTSDHLFLLKTIIDSFKSKRKPLYTCLIDLSKAFDSVWRDATYYQLLKRQKANV